MEKDFETGVSEFRAIVIVDRSYGISVPLVPQPQDKILNKTKRLPFLLKKEHPRITRVVIHPNKDIPLPTRRSHTSWANKVHMEQLAWALSHHIDERRVRRGYHLGMPTWCTNQLFLKPQPWQSSDQIEFTQASQSSSDPTSYATYTTHSKNQPRNNTQHQKTEKNQLQTLDPWERPYRQGPLESPKSENHQAETTPQNPHPIVGGRKANCIQAIEQEQHA
jgi:hypothetical protein